MTTLVYLFRGKVFIPILARTEAGFYMGLGPVEVVNTISVETLQQALTHVLAQGNPIIPNPPGGKAFPKDPVLKHAGVRSWAAFEKDAELWSIECKDDSFEIIPNRQRSDRGFEEDTDRKETLPSSVGVEGLARRLAEMIQLNSE